MRESSAVRGVRIPVVYVAVLVTYLTTLLRIVRGQTWRGESITNTANSSNGPTAYNNSLNLSSTSSV